VSAGIGVGVGQLVALLLRVLEGRAASVVVLLLGWLVFAASGMYGVAASATKQVGLGLVARMVFVLGGCLALRTARPEFGTWNFPVWLLVCYMATLAMETWTARSATPRATEWAAR